MWRQRVGASDKIDTMKFLGSRPKQVDPLLLSALEFAELSEFSANLLSVGGKKFGIAAIRWAVSQKELRIRATSKFSRAEKMLFTKEALEQASAEALARYHGSQFSSDIVADLTAGIGGDLIGHLPSREVVGFELDPERASYAQHNVNVYGLSSQVVVGNGLNHASDFLQLFCDPSRRIDGVRRSSIEEGVPPVSVVLGACPHAERIGIKLSPMVAETEIEGTPGRWEFISWKGECREAVLWWGKAEEPSRFAVQAETGERLCAMPSTSQIDDPLRYVYEADPAAIRAHCLGSLENQFDLHSLGGSEGYLTGKNPVASDWMRGYAVIDTIAFDRKRLRALLRSLDLRVAAVKVRGFTADASAIKKAIASEGNDEAIVLLYPVDRRMRAIVAKPLTALET